ncbi:hypothetical protein CCO03_18320 [Comamonas serinivorans]|uniref:DUF11 domain-containing protein n=2 Tax=Comamonas serinivorans TaxID=1082851 RepID=A0A1Y0ES76_9BURK|nr:hypothetical protein CCO03_18320 [Comamonas serinivorans]
MLALAVLAAPLAAQAQDRVLFISSDESANAGWNGYLTNARNAFEAVAPAGTFVNRTGALSGTASLTGDIADARMLILATVCSATQANRWAEVEEALKTRPDLMVISFVDGSTAPGCPANLARFTTAINAIRPAAWSPITATPTSGDITAPLNQQSLYAATFQAVLPSIRGQFWGRMSPVPTDYALYTSAAVASPAPATVTNAYGLFIPQAASNGGHGACLFFVADATQFNLNQPAQSTAIARAFYAAATDPSGACQQPVANVPDLTPSLAGATALNIGATHSVRLTVSNADQAASADGLVTVTLPAGLALVNAPAGCTPSATPPEGFSCPLSALAASGTLALDFDVRATAVLANAAISAEVSGVTGEVNTGNNSATLLVSASGAPDLTSTLTGPAQLNVGATGSYQVAVRNQGNLGSTDGVLTLVLPTGLALDAATLPAGCTAVATGFTCPLSAIAAGGSAAALSFSALATAAFTDQPIEVQVTQVNGEQVIGNNGASLLVTATSVPVAPTPAVQPVPSLQAGALGLLGLLLAGMPACVRRQPRALKRS